MAAPTWLGEQIRSATVGTIIFEESPVNRQTINRVRSLASRAGSRCGRVFSVSAAPAGDHPGFFLECVASLGQIPAARRGRFHGPVGAALLRLDVGQEVLLHGTGKRRQIAYTSRTANYYKKTHGLDFSCRRVDGGVLVRRVA